MNESKKKETLKFYVDESIVKIKTLTFDSVLSSDYEEMNATMKELFKEIDELGKALTEMTNAFFELENECMNYRKKYEELLLDKGAF